MLQAARREGRAASASPPAGALRGLREAAPAARLSGSRGLGAAGLRPRLTASDGPAAGASADAMIQ